MSPGGRRAAVLLVAALALCAVLAGCSAQNHPPVAANLPPPYLPLPNPGRANQAPRLASGPKPAIFIPVKGVAIFQAEGGASASAVATDAQGRILLAGRSRASDRSVVTVVRYTAEGALDASFGGGAGVVTTPIGSGDSSVSSLALDGSGRIVLAGTSKSSHDRNVFTVVRYTTAGELDTSFGADAGIVTTAIGSGNAAASSVVLDASGRIVVAGTATVGDSSVMALARYTAAGVLDTGFGAGAGIVTTPIGSYPIGSSAAAHALAAAARSLALDASGRIVVAGISQSFTSVVVRYTAAGELDTSFGAGAGIVTTPLYAGPGGGPVYGVPLRLALDASGRIVVVGTTQVASAGACWCWPFVTNVLRLTVTGALDTSFGAGAGIVRSPADDLSGVALDASGRIVVAGASWYSSPGFIVVRYTAGGSLDTSFGGGAGIVTTAIGSGNAAAPRLALDDSGRIVVAGTATVRGSTVWALARYTAAGALDTSFNDFDPVGQPFVLSVAGRFYDNDGDALTYTATLADGSALPASIGFNAGTQTFTGTVPAGVTGLTVTATDPSGLAISETYYF